MYVRAEIRLQSRLAEGGYRITPNRYAPEPTWRGWDLRDLPPEWCSAPAPRERHGYSMIDLDVSPATLASFVEMPWDPHAYMRFASRHGLLEDGISPVQDPRGHLLDPRGFTRAGRLFEYGVFHSHLRNHLGLSMRDEPPFIERMRWVYADRNTTGADGTVASERYRLQSIESQKYLVNIVRFGLLPEVSNAGGTSPELVLRATSLQVALSMQALWHHLPGHAPGSTERRSCFCGKTFLVGQGHARRDRRFCSQLCREREKKRRQRASPGGRA